METIWNSIKSLAIWQILVLLAVMFGSAFGVYYFYADRTQPEVTELAENQQLIPIRYGDIVNQVSTNGNVDFPERKTVYFSVRGDIGELLVSEGDTVVPGQELARLDSSTIEILEDAVEQAKVDLLQAEDALVELLERPSEITLALDRAAAEEKVAEARFQVRQAEDALEELLDPEIPTLLDLETVKEKIAATELLMEQLADEREDLLNPELPTDQDIRAQEELIADARVKLQEAIDSRDELLSRDLLPDYQMTLADSLQKKADAEKELADIQEALEELEPSERQLVEAFQGRLQGPDCL